MHEEAAPEQVWREQAPPGNIMSQLLRAIGLMSGTSMDGIDVALIETDGEDAVRRGPSATFGYDAGFRGRLAAAIDDALVLTDRNGRRRTASERRSAS